MPATYSINNNTAYEAARLATIGDVLNQLPDNTNKLMETKNYEYIVFLRIDLYIKYFCSYNLSLVITSF